MATWGRWLGCQARRATTALVLGLCGLIAACGGGGGDAGAQAQAVDGGLTAATDVSVALLAGVPAGASALPDQRIAAVATPAAPATSLRVHYRRADGNHAGWQIHT